MSLGKFPSEVDEMPFPDVIDLMEYQKENPPMHLLHKWFVGYKRKKTGELNKFERDALTQNLVIPATAVPLYVQHAMKRHAQEKLNAR